MTLSVPRTPLPSTDGAAPADLLVSALAPGSERDGAIAAAARAVAEEAAGPAAAAVDAEARFPGEAVAAMREHRLLAALVPVANGGLGASVAEVAGAVRILAGACASSALVLAMHSIEVANLARHGTTPELVALLEDVGHRQLLLANANSEVGVGGDVSRSICALTTVEGGLHLEKQALAISYGENADVVLASARRGPDAAETDQVYVACPRADLHLERTSAWDTMGLRGTCSMSFRLEATVAPGLVFPVPFAEVANRGGGQLRQVLLSAAWVGLAEAAAARAHAAVRKAARKAVGTVPSSAVRLSEIGLEVQAARSLLAGAALWYEAVADSDELEHPALVMALRNLKVSTSRLAVRAATEALAICGIEGYRREGPLSLDRVLRDAHGGVVMVSNDRYLQDNAQLLCVAKQL